MGDALCISCRRFGMCKKQIKIHKYLNDYAIDTLDETDVQLDITYSIADCHKYSPMPDCEMEVEEDDIEEGF